MKKTSILILVSILLLSCESDNEKENKSNSITGYWKPAYTIELYHKGGSKDFEEKVNKEGLKSPIVVFNSNGKAYMTELDKAGFEIEKTKHNFIYWQENNTYKFESLYYTLEVKDNYLIVQQPYTIHPPAKEGEIQHFGTTDYYIKASSKYTPKK